jgi:sugar lactone lactonase YvrE
MPEPRTLLTGLMFGESPRWHDGRLWFSDMGAQQALSVDLDGNSEVVASVPGMPMGIGWLPEGRMLIVSARDGRLLRVEPDGSLETHADLAALDRHPWSDMVVDGRGNAYIGNIGFDFPGGEFATGILALVTPDGSARQVADGIAFANGMAVTPDNATLILAESYASRLTAFDIAADGGLSNRRVWADLDGGVPDGICLDAEGAIWYGDVPNKRCVRVREGGEVLETVQLDRGCFACALGGADDRTLFMMAAEFSTTAGMGGRPTGQVLTTTAPAPPPAGRERRSRAPGAITLTWATRRSEAGACMGESQVEKVRRWELSGATWRVVHRSGTHAVVELCACTGELMETLASTDSELLEYLDARSRAGSAEPSSPCG